MSNTNATKQLIAKAIKKVLASLVRLIVRHGITFPELNEWLKQAYVEEVKKELEKQGEKSTLSRISLISGVHRKDVKRLTDLSVEEEQSKTEKISLTSRLLSLWMGDSSYLDHEGEPLVLPKTGTPSFESLVISISRDVRPRTVLDDLIQRGIIKEEPQGYRLIQEAIFPSDDLATKMAFFGRNTADHIATCEHNIRGDQPSLPERSVFYNHLSAASVEQLRGLADKESKALIVKLNKQAQQFAKQDDQQALKDSYRFILGTYFYQTKDDSDE
ncbi:DUF6502 family protein [Marinomonas sp. THO17]|uniref:DUF6502 family protein n=1 Tax=Marinomonas sp. THO17 TaxID=3149048 RepID=UPI00336BE3BB